MRSYSLTAPAKINLYLEILGDRPDGFHELAMILQSVSLADQVDLRAMGTDRIQVHCDHPQVPKDQTNLAYRAAALMKDQFPEAFARFGGVDIHITKRIPVGAGLAGGSTNAAAVLVGIDLMWNLGLTMDEIRALGAKLGSDIAFCVAGGTAIATSRGEKLSPLPSLDNLHLVLAKYESLSVSTAWAYTTYREQFNQSYVSDSGSLETRRQRVHSGDMVAAITQQNYSDIGQQLYNDLEKVVLPAHPTVQQLRDRMGELGSLGVMMSGSGPTVFALVESAEQAQKMQADLKAAIADDDLKIWTTQTIPNGIQIADH